MWRLAALTLVLVAAAPRGAEAGLTKARPLKTGQSIGFGAAGDVTKGVARSYVDLGGGVVKDQKTGLFWEVKSDDGSIHDKDTLFTWTSGTEAASGTAFTQFLAQLNCAGSFAVPGCTPFGGFSDWRLPTRFELVTLVDLGRTVPAVAPEFNKDCTPSCTVTSCTCTSTGVYWSSSSYSFLPNQAWGVSFDYAGFTQPLLKTSSAYVRAVRGGS